MIFEPPSEDILPPLTAEVEEIDDTELVLISTTRFLQDVTTIYSEKKINKNFIDTIDFNQIYKKQRIIKKLIA
jgi:hypothetical protein